LSVMKPERPDVVTPWPNMLDVAANAKASAPARIHLTDG
jgi:hypothetical protein